MTATVDRPELDNKWLPDHCPPWCAQEHAVALAEGCSWESAQKHHRGAGGDCLDELRNSQDGRVMRPGGGGWNLHAEQTPMYGGGYLTVATVNLAVDSPDRKGRIELALTSGEARVLARQLVALADRLDLS